MYLICDHYKNKTFFRKLHHSMVVQYYIPALKKNNNIKKNARKYKISGKEKQQLHHYLNLKKRKKNRTVLSIISKQ